MPFARRLLSDASGVSIKAPRRWALEELKEGNPFREEMGSALRKGRREPTWVMGGFFAINWPTSGWSCLG